MGYVISYQALRDIYSQMALVVNDTVNERIPKINEVLSEFIYDNKIQGKTADTIKTYLTEAHGVILQGILSVSQQLLSKFILYQNGYYNIDSNRDTVIDESFVNFIDEAVKDFVKKQSELNDNFKVHTNAISDIYVANAPQDWNIKSIGGIINRKNENLNNEIINYERTHKNGLSDIEELIINLKSTIEACRKNLGGFDIATNDLTILKENIAKVYEFQRDNSAEIEEASYNQQAILEEIWTEEQAKLRKKEGVWQCVASVVTIVVGGAAIILSGGVATPIVLGVGTVAFGTSNAIEGGQDVYYGSVGDISSQSFNPIRDTVFLGNQRAYDIAECIVTFAAGASIPLTNAIKMGKVVTTVDKAKFIGVEIFKEAVGTAGGFGGVWLGEKLGLSQDQSMLLGMTTSIVSSKGADWVDNNLDNLTLATKYTFNNSGKNVTLGCNGGDLYGFGKDYYNNFKKFKNGEIIFNSIDDVINSGINSVDDLAKLKVSSIDDLAKIGIKNADDLAKLGIDSSDLRKLGIDPKVFDRVTQVNKYADVVNSNKVWNWAEDIPGGAELTAKQRKEIRQEAIEKGLIPDVKMKPGTKYPDFEGAGLVQRVEQLPEKLWNSTDRKQFEWLDSRIKGGRPEGTTWHHSEIDGRMELVPFGIHNIINHKGGRSLGNWSSYGKR